MTVNQNKYPPCFGDLEIVFPEGEAPRIVRAAKILADEGICHPILLGNAATPHIDHLIRPKVYGAKRGNDK